MRRGERCRHEVEERRDAERHLGEDDERGRGRPAAGRAGEVWAEARVGEGGQGEEGEERRDGLSLSVARCCQFGHEEKKKGGGGTHKHAVIKLDRRRVLEHVAPPSVRAVHLAGISLGVVELRKGRNDALAHLGELIVDQAGVETSDEGA